jgi:O-antigen/teichoic acid export membrane protein
MPADNCASCPPALVSMQPIREIKRLWLRLARTDLASNAMWSAIGEAIFRGTALIATAIVARLLGAADFGVFGLVRNAANQFGGVGSAGLGLTANRYLPAYLNTDRRRAGAVIGTSLGISVLVGALLAIAGFTASEWIAASLFGKPELENTVWLAVALVVIAGIGGAQLGIIQGLEAYRSLAFGYLLSGIAGGAALLAGTYSFGLRGALAGLATMAVANLLVFHLLIVREARRRRVQILWWEWRPLIGVLLGFSLPSAMITLAIGPLRWLAESLLARTSGFAEAGVFYAGMIVFSLVVGLVMTLHSPLMAMVARRTAEGAVGRLPWVSLYASWFAFLIVSLPLLAVPSLPARLLGAEYPPELFSRVMLLILLYCGMQSYAQGLSRAIVQSGSMWFQLLLSVVEGVVLIIAFLLLVDRGSVGLALACVISYCARLLITVPAVARSRVVAPALLTDRWFLISLGAYLTALTVQWLSI